MKNIKPNTKYYITFKEKTELTEVTNPAHGLYLKPDTASAVSDVTDAAQVTHAALTRNNGNIGIHQEACADTDWEERTIEWTSGSGIDTDKFPGDDVLAAKLEFTFRSALGTVQIKDLEMFEEPKESEFAPLSLAGEGIKQYSVIIDKIFRNITIPVYPGTDEWYICYHRFHIPLFGNFEGQASEPGNHREVCIDKMEFDDAGNINVVTATLEGITEPVYIPQGNISVSADGTNVSGVYSINYRGADEKFAAYLAAYDEDGRLLKLVSRDADEGRTEFSMDTDGLEVDTVKAFLWNGEQNSVCDAVTVE